MWTIWDKLVRLVKSDITDTWTEWDEASVPDYWYEVGEEDIAKERYLQDKSDIAPYPDLWTNPDI